MRNTTKYRHALGKLRKGGYSCIHLQHGMHFPEKTDIAEVRCARFNRYGRGEILRARF